MNFIISTLISFVASTSVLSSNNYACPYQSNIVCVRAPCNVCSGPIIDPPPIKPYPVDPTPPTKPYPVDPTPPSYPTNPYFPNPKPYNPNPKPCNKMCIMIYPSNCGCNNETY